MDNSHICVKCRKSCSSIKKLKKHVRSCCPSDSNVLVSQRGRNNSNGTFSCKSCGKIFNRKHNLRVHMEIHGDIIDLTNQSSPEVDVVIRNTKMCPICQYSDPPKGNFLHHLLSQHDISIISEDIKFAFECDFYKWKHEVENVNQCKFLQRYCTKKSKFYETTNFFCQYSGFYVPIKSKKSKIVSAYCPASIRLEKKHDGTCEVSYLKTHVGHENKVNSVQVTSTDDIPSEIREVSLVERKNDDDGIASQVIEIKEENDNEPIIITDNYFVPEPEQRSNNLNTSASESLDDDKQKLIDRITGHIRNIQSGSKLDILGKMTDKLIEVLNDT